MNLETITYYGLTIYYRRENRNDGDRMALSLRDDKAILAEKNLRIPKNLSSSCDNEIANVLTPRFLRLCLSVKNPVLSREEWIPRLPLAVIWAIDEKDIARPWKQSTWDEYKRAIEWLVSKYGNNTLSQLIPESIADSFRTLSDRTTQARVRAIKALFDYEVYTGIIKENPWENYQYAPNTRKRKKPEQLSKMHLEQTMFTDAQMSLLIIHCLGHLSGTLGRWYAGMITLLTSFLSAPELCALTVADLVRQTTLPVTFIGIDKIRVKEHKNWSNQPYPDELKIRDMPLCTVAAHAWDQVCPEPSKAPLLPRQDNTARFADPTEYAKWVCEVVNTVLGLTLSVQQLRIWIGNTVERNLRKAGVEEQEIRYLRGLSRTTTAAQSYEDYESEWLHYKMSQGFDRWLAEIITLNPPTSETFSKQIRQISEKISLCDPAGQHQQYHMRLTIRAKKDGDYSFAVGHSLGALDITASAAWSQKYE